MSRMQPRLNLAHEPEHPPRPTSQQTMMLVSTAALLAFSPSMPMAPGQAARSACSVRMAEAPLARRAFVGTFAAAAVGMAPLAAFADGAASPATRERARAIYGSRIARLSNAPAADILEEKNAFKLFISGAYRSDAATKELRGKLTSISASTIASAKAGDSSGAQAGVKVRLILPTPHTPPRAAVPEARKFKLSPCVSTSPPAQEFVKIADLRVLDTLQNSIWDPKQRRNAGAPTTDTIEAQMGPMAYALYQPLK